VHVAGVPELPHARVNEWNASATLLPRLHGGRVCFAPREQIKFWPEVLLGDIGLVEEDVVGKLTPPYFGEKLGAIFFTSRWNTVVHRVPDGVGADFAKPKVWAQPGGGFNPWLIAPVILGKGVVDEAFQSIEGTDFSGGP